MNYYLRFTDSYYTEPGIILTQKEFETLSIEFQIFVYKNILMVPNRDRYKVLKFLHNIKLTERIDRLLE